jgi:hypothetical protein
MSINKNSDPDIPLTAEDGYLKMNVGSPTRSVLFSPSSNKEQFQFPSTSKLSPTDKHSANVSELKPMLSPGMKFTDIQLNGEASRNSDIPDHPPPSPPNEESCGQPLSSITSPCFDNPSYRFLGQGEGRKRGYSEASSSGFHSERDSLGHSPKQSDEEPRSSSPPPYQEATAMGNSFLV